MNYSVERIFDQNIVTIGGGGGSNVILEGLTLLNNPSKNKAIFGTWDDGSKSGEVRRKHGVMPPGDMFMCLLGMMEDPEQYEAARVLLLDRSDPILLRDQLWVKAEHRYHGMEAGVTALRKLFRISGDLIPVSNMDHHLSAETKRGNIINGETNIDKREDDTNFDPSDVTRNIFFDVPGEITKRAEEAILGADKVLIVPGSPYTSIFPHQLIRGVSRVLLATEAEIVVIPNLSTARGEDHHLDKLSRWVQEFQFLLCGNATMPRGEKSPIDYLVLNSRKPSAELRREYHDKGQKIVEFDRRRLARVAPGVHIVQADLLDEEELKSKLIRHDPVKTVRVALELPFRRVA